MGHCSKHCTLQTPTHTTAHSQMVPLPTTRQLTPCHLPVLSFPASELLPRLQNKANAHLYESLQSLKVEALDNIKTNSCSRNCLPLSLFAENLHPICDGKVHHYTQVMHVAIPSAHSLITNLSLFDQSLAST